MKIGIVSNIPRTGRTVIMMLLAQVFARSQRRRVAVFSTGELGHIVNPIRDMQEPDDANSVGVFRAMLETGTIAGRALFDYSVRSSRDNVFVFNLIDDNKSIGQSFEFLSRTLKTIDADMVIVEIRGRIDDPKNAEVVNTCDRIINVFNQDVVSINLLKQRLNSLSDKQRSKCVLVCNRFDDRVCSELKLSGLVGVGRKYITTVEDNEVLARLINNGEFEKLTSGIVYGDPTMISLRRDAIKLMRCAVDTETRRIIKGHEYWPKQNEE